MKAVHVSDSYVCFVESDPIRIHLKKWKYCMKPVRAKV